MTSAEEHPTPQPSGRPTERPAGSVASEAFESALASVRHYRPEHPSRRPAFEYSFPGDLETPSPSGWMPRSVPSVGRNGRDTIVAASHRIRSGEQSCRELVEQALLAVAKYDAELVALAELTATEALETADALDADLASGRHRGPLHGIPITVKDVIDVAGVPTRAGSAAYYDVPSLDAEGVARLRAAGAIVIGKATTHEFALGVTSPQSHNPHDPSRIPGGSSGGSAIAVATGMGLGSLGTDTRASIRVPAALSGVVGLKPTYGSVPTTGVVPLSWTMDHVAPMASTVIDAAILLDALIPDRSGFAASANAPVAGCRIGLPDAAFASAESEVEQLVRQAIDALVSIGCVRQTVDRPNDADLDNANAAGLIVSRCEAATFHRSLHQLVGADRSLYWEEVAEQLDEADRITALDYLDAQRLRADLAATFLACFDHADVLAMPTSPAVAPKRDDFARYLTVLSRNAIPWSLVGFPAISVPCGMTAAGLPVGIQFVARPGAEHQILAIGAALEQAQH